MRKRHVYITKRVKTIFAKNICLQKIKVPLPWSGGMELAIYLACLQVSKFNVKNPMGLCPRNRDQFGVSVRILHPRHIGH